MSATVNSSKVALAAFRTIAKELKNILPDGPLKSKPAYKYVLDQYRYHDVTSKRVCRGQKEVEQLASTYACYLRSIRLQRELHQKYHKGERTTAEAAHMVGLELPNKRVD